MEDNVVHGHTPWDTLAVKISQSNFDYTRGITLKRVRSGGVHRDFTPGQHSSEETSQWWHADGDTEFYLTDPGFEPQTFRTDNVLATAYYMHFICTRNSATEGLVLYLVASSYHKKANKVL